MRTLTILCMTSTLLCSNGAKPLLCKNPEKHLLELPAQKASYQDCQRNGMTWWYNEKGDVKSKVNFINGQENGIYTSYHDNGEEKLVVNYTDGQKNGMQKMYYDNGQLGMQINYVMGKREGILTEWAYEGYKSSEVFYKNNYMVGIKKYFDKEGKVIKTEEYKMDRNPVMQKILKDKRNEILIDLSKYGLMPQNTPKEERIK
jgi:hypothetical protein